MKSPVEMNSLLKFLSPGLKTTIDIMLTQIVSRVYYSVFKLLMNALKETTQFTA